ncbi:uncharacterized protein LOC119733206 [Patiria miniata]|uniref:Uncharacterized protein n=1 Tax=Patiria miniata TaxID=46514 RepID=A0A914AGS4_PATMI|nr:uncharacterized protein LOC119733206 [Patiria miniata]
MDLGGHAYRLGYSPDPSGLGGRTGQSATVHGPPGPAFCPAKDLTILKACLGLVSWDLHVVALFKLILPGCASRRVTSKNKVHATTDEKLTGEKRESSDEPTTSGESNRPIQV